MKPLRSFFSENRRAVRLWLGIGTGLALVCALVFFLRPAPCEKSPAAFAMGSYIEQTFAVRGGGREETARLAYSAVRELEDLISWRVEGSDVYRLNENGPDGAALDPRTWALLQVCDGVSSNSGGAFDPTIGPVSRLWDFDGDPHVPDQGDLAAALELVDHHALSLPYEYDGSLAVGHCLDLGAVGKGAACDEILRVWRAQGVEYGVAAVGGSVGLYGQKPWGRPWSVAVRDPAGNGSLGALSLRGGCVSTSGSYEKTFTQDGQTYHHLLDPKTGFPAESGLVSVTVWRNEGDGADGAYADALSTACFVLGMKKSLPLLELFHGEALFVTEERQVFVTPGLENAFALTGEGYRLEGTL